MDLLKFGRVARQSLGLLIVCTLAGAGIGLGAGLLQRSRGSAVPTTRYYSATETLGYDTSATGPSSVGGTSALTSVGAFVTGPAVTDEVGKRLDGDGVALAHQVTTVAWPTTNSVDVTAFADSAGRAQKLATVFSDATEALYAEELASQSENQATQLGKRLDDLKARRVDVETQLANPNLSAVDRDVLNAASRRAGQPVPDRLRPLHQPGQSRHLGATAVHAGATQIDRGRRRHLPSRARAGPHRSEPSRRRRRDELGGDRRTVVWPSPVRTGGTHAARCPDRIGGGDRDRDAPGTLRFEAAHPSRVRRGVRAPPARRRPRSRPRRAGSAHALGDRAPLFLRRGGVSFRPIGAPPAGDRRPRSRRRVDRDGHIGATERGQERQLRELGRGVRRVGPLGARDQLRSSPPHLASLLRSRQRSGARPRHQRARPVDRHRRHDRQDQSRPRPGATAFLHRHAARRTTT